MFIPLWLAASALIGLFTCALRNNYFDDDKAFFMLRKIFITCTTIGLLWIFIVTVHVFSFINSYRGHWIIPNGGLVVVIIIAIIYTIRNKPVNFINFKPNLHIGMLIASIGYLLIIGVPHGWLTQGLTTTWTDTVRYTETSRYQYHVHIRRTWRTNEITLAITDTYTDTYTDTKHPLNLPFDEQFGHRFPASPTRFGYENWGYLTATNDPNVYVFTTTLSLFYRRVAFMINFYTNKITSTVPEALEFLYHPIYSTTADGLFDYRIEIRQRVNETIDNSELRLRMVNTNNGNIHIFTLLTGSTARIRVNQTDPSELHESLRLEPTTTSPHIFTVILPRRFAIFEINLMDNTIITPQEYFYGPWRTTAKNTLEYRIVVEPINFAVLNFNGESFHQSAFPSARARIQIRNITTGNITYTWLPWTVRQQITVDDLLSPLDWLYLHPIEGSVNYTAEITIPANNQRREPIVFQYTFDRSAIRFMR